MTGDNVYLTGEYLDMSGGTWHAQDSPWKAAQILKMIQRHDLRPSVIGEVGCGSGVVLQELSAQPGLHGTLFEGYDISHDAIAIANELDTSANVQFYQADPLDDESRTFDILLAIDVFEHVPDYMGFLERCQRRSEYKIYHIPLDINLLQVLRNNLSQKRYNIGHLHYFVADSALDTLRDTGHDVVDYFYTDGALALFHVNKKNRTFKATLAYLPRWIAFQFSPPLAARLFGGFSLLVLAK